MGYRFVSVDTDSITSVTSINNGIARCFPPTNYVEKQEGVMQPKCECHPRCRCDGLGVTDCGCKWDPSVAAPAPRENSDGALPDLGD